MAAADHIFEAHCEDSLLFAYHWSSYSCTSENFRETPLAEVIIIDYTCIARKLTTIYFPSDVAVHLEVVALLLIAIIGAGVQLLHRHSRQDLRLRHEPGTIASAVSIGAQTNLAHLLNGQHEQDDFIKALQNRKFRIDTRTMKIVMQGEQGYEQAASPNPRQSIFGTFGLQGSSGNKRGPSLRR